ncbi:hypothetical protein ACFWY9_13925, partial [Amycolatopsis sp. NPDC059027]
MRPPRLREGDTIALVAPAGPVPQALLDAALPVLRGWGVRVRGGPGGGGAPAPPPVMCALVQCRLNNITSPPQKKSL